MNEELTIRGLLDGYRSKALRPTEVIGKILLRLDADPAVWISRFSDGDLLARARELEEIDPASLPLYGIPFAVKDNIDVAGLSTTAGCPDFAYRPDQHAAVVRCLADAGALCIGKTNLDQFATGLVGVRSPYGVPRNPFDAHRVPGGSSSGSAVAVALGHCAFALGTDTAGSGRVPAAFNNLVGWKPTRGLVSTRGVVPACRTLDCVSIFAHTVDDIGALMPIVSGFDTLDPFSRKVELQPAVEVRRVAVPMDSQLELCPHYRTLWDAAVAGLRRRDIDVIETDITAFLQAAELLYGGPWVAERRIAVGELMDRSPESLHPVTLKILSGADALSAVSVYEAAYRLAALRREAEALWESADLLFLPTAPNHPTLREVEEDPVGCNTRLGRFTNFLNLLDLCAVAVPSGFCPDGLPFGVTLVAPAGSDRTPLAFAGMVDSTEGLVPVAVCGAHLRGLPLNSQLTDRGSRFLGEATTSADYRLYALDNLRPGMVRVSSGGAPLAVEVWGVPTAGLGGFLAGIPSPLGLGKITLSDGREVTGFLCESVAVDGKPDITCHGGWKAWLAYGGLQANAVGGLAVG